MDTAPPTLVFGVTGVDAVAQAIVALGLRFASEPDAAGAPPTAHRPMPFSADEEDEEEEDVDDPWDDTDLDDEDEGADGWDDTPPSNVRQAQPSVFAQMVGGAVVGRRARPQERARRPTPRVTPTTPQPPTAVAAPRDDLDAGGGRLGDVLERLHAGEVLADPPRMLHARMDAALQGAATLAPIAPPPTGAALRLDTTGGMALSLTLGQGTLDSETEARLHAYLRAVFPEWAGSGILAVDP